MPGKEVAVPRGRAVSAPETPHDGHSSKAAGPIPVRLVAPSLQVTAVVNARTPAAYAVIGGEKSDEVEITWDDGMWTLRWPEDAGVTGSDGTVQAGTVYGGIVFGNNNVQVNNFSTRRGSSGPPREQPVVHLLLPSGCSLHGEFSFGTVTLPEAPDPRHGVALVSVHNEAGDIEAGCAVGKIALSSAAGGVIATGFTGPVSVNTASGSIELEHAMGDVQAQTMSGDVRVHCEDSITVNGTTMSGQVRVTAAPGARPRGHVSSIAGSVRKPW